MSKYNVNTVEDYWSTFDCSESEKNFYAFPPIRSRSSKLIFDEFDASRRDWCEYWTVEKFLKDKMPFENCLSICCGFGNVERVLARLNVAKKIFGTDIAPGAVEKAKNKALEEGFSNIEYFVADLNIAELEENKYDLIWANGALHHIKELNTVIPKLYKSLKPGGMLVANEYVGPNYYQISERQQEIINAVKHLLPEELIGKSPIQTDHSFLGRVYRFIQRKLKSGKDNSIYGQLYERNSVDHFLKTDPSEGINSSNIIPSLNASFSDVDIHYYDGSILLYALDQTFYQNFDSSNLKHRALLDMLFKVEDALIESGELHRDNAHIICRK